MISNMHRTCNLAAANPDILDYSAVTGCRINIGETRNEELRVGSGGKEVSYGPPRYKYAYDFKITLSVSNPYSDEMRFRLSDGYI